MGMYDFKNTPAHMTLALGATLVWAASVALPALSSAPLTAARGWQSYGFHPSPTLPMGRTYRYFTGEVLYPFGFG